MNAAFEDKFKKLRYRLDSLGFKQPLGFESIPLVEKLLSDFLRIVDKHNACNNETNSKANLSLVEALKTENSKLAKEAALLNGKFAVLQEKYENSQRG